MAGLCVRDNGLSCVQLLGAGAGVLPQPSPAKTGNKMNTNKMAPLRDIDTRVSPMGKPAYGGLWEHSSLAGSGVGCFFH